MLIFEGDKIVGFDDIVRPHMLIGDDVILDPYEKTITLYNVDKKEVLHIELSGYTPIDVYYKGLNTYVVYDNGITEGFNEEGRGWTKTEIKILGDTYEGPDMFGKRAVYYTPPPDLKYPIHMYSHGVSFTKRYMAMIYINNNLNLCAWNTEEKTTTVTSEKGLLVGDVIVIINDIEVTMYDTVKNIHFTFYVRELDVKNIISIDLYRDMCCIYYEKYRYFCSFGYNTVITNPEYTIKPVFHNLVKSARNV